MTQAVSATRSQPSSTRVNPQHDPDVLATVGEVDRSLIQAELRLSPLERLVASVQQARFYERLAPARQTAPGGMQ